MEAEDVRKEFSPIHAKVHLTGNVYADGKIMVLDLNGQGFF